MLGTKSGTDITTLLFGSIAATNTANNLGTAYGLSGGNPINDAQIAITNYDTDKLNDLFLIDDLSSYSYSNQFVNLNTTNRDKGLVLFARVNNHYAKIIILKKGGTYLQNPGTTNAYIHLLVSYQKRQGVPYAKPVFE
jgi:hypothetical protein